MENIELASLIKANDKPETWVEYRDGITFKLTYLSRPELQKIVKRSTVFKYDEKAKTRVQTTDSEKLTEEFCKAVVKDWKGVTFRSLATMTNIDLKAIAEERRDFEIAFSHDNCVTLMREAYDVDTFIQEASTDIRYFNAGHAEEIKN